MKYAEEIKAWADGKPIEFRHQYLDGPGQFEECWSEWQPVSPDSWFFCEDFGYQYRRRPETPEQQSLVPII